MGLLSARSVLMGLCLLRLFHGALSATQGFNGALSASPHSLMGLDTRSILLAKKMNHHTALLC